jgi:hypothetical protein
VLIVAMLPFKILAFVLGTGWRVGSAVVGGLLRLFRFVFTHSLGATIGVIIGLLIGRKLAEKAAAGEKHPAGGASDA